MSIELMLVFAVAAAIMLAVPAPGTLLVVSYASTRRPKAVIACAIGFVAGWLAVLVVGFAGAVVIDISSPDLLVVTGWAGAACLVGLALRAALAPLTLSPIADNDNVPKAQVLRITRDSFRLTAMKPRTLIFFAALLPQVFDSTRPLAQQLLSLAAIIAVLATVSMTGYALFSRHVQAAIRKISLAKSKTRTPGSVRVNAGMVAVGYRRLAA